MNLAIQSAIVRRLFVEAEKRVREPPPIPGPLPLVSALTPNWGDTIIVEPGSPLVELLFGKSIPDCFK